VCGLHGSVIVVVQKEEVVMNCHGIAIWVYQFSLAYTHFTFF
jgi:hypothetical protein